MPHFFRLSNKHFSNFSAETFWMDEAEVFSRDKNPGRLHCDVFMFSQRPEVSSNIISTMENVWKMTFHLPCARGIHRRRVAARLFASAEFPWITRDKGRVRNLWSCWPVRYTAPRAFTVRVPKANPPPPTVHSSWNKQTDSAEKETFFVPPRLLDWLDPGTRN